METYIDDMKWRYATKKFDSEKKIAAEDLNKLLESVRLSASSYGLQPYEIFIIEDQKIREELKPALWNQRQATEASHLVIFANLKDIDAKYIKSHIKRFGQVRKMDQENLKPLEEKLSKRFLNSSTEDNNIWAAKQTYLALGNLLAAAASFKIDACPMEGFETPEINKILQLEQKGLTTAVVAAIGYRSDEDQQQFAPKVRKNKEELFHVL